MNSIFSVTTPATDIGLLTIEELRAAAGVTGNAEDTRLQALGLQVALSIATQCGIASDGINPATLLSEGCKDVFRISAPRECLRLSRRPVTAIASVLVGEETIDPSEYEINKAAGLLTALSGDCVTCWRYGKITVNYTAGYSAVPVDLKLAASKLVTALNAETARDPSLKRERVDGVSELEYWVAPSNDPLLTQEISDLLASYKQWW